MNFWLVILILLRHAVRGLLYAVLMHFLCLSKIGIVIDWVVESIEKVIRISKIRIQLSSFITFLCVFRLRIRVEVHIIVWAILLNSIFISLVINIRIVFLLLCKILLLIEVLLILLRNLQLFLLRSKILFLIVILVTICIVLNGRCILSFYWVLLLTEHIVICYVILVLLIWFILIIKVLVLIIIIGHVIVSIRGKFETLNVLWKIIETSIFLFFLQ